MKVVYVAHPVGAPTPEGVAQNLARARRWLRWILRHYEVAVVADWSYCELLDDHNPADRAFGLACDEATVKRCDEIWLVGGVVSSGMRHERDTAAMAGVRVVDLTFLGAEPPKELPVTFDAPRR